MSSPSIDRLAAVRLSSLARGDGGLMSTLPVTLVSLRHQVRFDSAFGRLASGPVSALYLPARFRVRVAEGDEARGVFAVTWTGDASLRARAELLPARVPIPDAVHSVMLGCECDVPWVRDVDPGSPLAAVLAWLREHAERRRARCSGRLVSRVALRQWSSEVVASEDALIGAHAAGAREWPLPAALAGTACARRFSRVTGVGPRHYAREYRRRVAAR